MITFNYKVRKLLKSSVGTTPKTKFVLPLFIMIQFELNLVCGLTKICIKV